MRYLYVIVLILLTGCGVKEYQLFSNKDVDLIDNSQEINISFDSKIVADDILSIDIYNMNQKSNILNSDKKNNQYIVSSDGSIYLPLVQEIEVVGYTAKELSKKITDEYKKYLKQPYAKVTIKNHKVFVLGEVQKQGIVPIEGNSISVIEALSKAGGLTDYASRDKIRIISKYGKKYKMRTLDMSKLSTLNIDNLILRNNSIVYAEPRSLKAIRVGVQDYLPIIQAISSTASALLAIDYISNGRE